MHITSDNVKTLTQLSSKKDAQGVFTPTPQQYDIINHYKGHALVVAGPGSGKTVSLVAHVEKLIQGRNISPKHVWVLAFNRDISSKLKEKISKALGKNSPEATTIHTFILQQTRNHGPQLLDKCEITEKLGDIGKSNLLWKPITRRLKEQHGIVEYQGKRLISTHVKSNLYGQLVNFWLTGERPDDEIFNKFKGEIERCKKIYKIMFLDELAYKFVNELVGNPSFKREVSIPRIIIDEFQDLNPTEHKILRELGQAGSVFVVFGDDDQAVNDFRKAHADLIHEFEKIYKPKKYPLARDRRCPKQILELADAFVCELPRIDKSADHAPHKGRVDVINFLRDDEELEGISKIVKKYIRLFPIYKENPQILILSSSVGSRSKSRITDIIKALESEKITGITGEKKYDPFDSEWGLVFKSYLSMLANGLSPMNAGASISVMNPSTVKKVNEYIEKQKKLGRNLNFLKAIIELRKSNGKIENFLSGIEELTEKLKDGDFHPNIIINTIPNNLKGRKEAELLIGETWKEYQDKCALENLESTGQGYLRVMDKYIDENIRNPEIGQIHVTTYRKAKGLEADLVIVTSVDSVEFQLNDQKRRLLYVAATRAKKNLILTFADHRTGARKYTKARDPKDRGKSKVYCSPLIPSEKYPTKTYSEQWLKIWQPV